MPIDLPDDFLAFLRSEQGRGVDTTLEDARATAIKFYEGRPYGDEVEGRSQAVTRDVAEVIDFMQPAIMNTILASGKAVEFETEPEPEIGEDGQPVMKPAQGGQPGPGKPVMRDYGEEATAAVRYHFFRKQKGYRVIHDALKAGQVEKTGIVKTYAEPQPSLHEQRQVLADEIQVGDSGPSVQGMAVVAAEPAEMEGLWNVTLEIPQPPVFRDVNVPNEYFRVSPDAIDLDEAVYVGERMERSLSDLVKLGYDVAELEALGTGGGSNDTTIETARDSNRSQTRQSVGRRPGANRMVWLEEEYVLYDMNGDGIAERLFVHRVGNTVLKVMEVDEQPYSIWSPFPMQHRLVGDSVADKTMDIQRIDSVLLRSALDSLYQSTAPRMLVDEGSMTVDTIDDLLTVRPGGLVRYKGNAPQPLTINDSSALAFQGMEVMKSHRESRTGITSQAQGINADVLNRTASGLAMNLASAQQIELYITRNFAEMLVASMFAKRYRLMRKFGQPFRMKIEGVFKEIDPAKWPEEIDMSINVGIGTGNKDQKIQAEMQMLQIQREGIVNGLRIFDEEKVYNTVRRFAMDSGMGAPSEFVINPSDLPPIQQQKDPATAQAEADAAQKQAELAAKQQHESDKLQVDVEKMRIEGELRSQQQEYDLTAKREASALDAQLKQNRANLEAELAWAKLREDVDLAHKRLEAEMSLKRATYEGGNDDLPVNRSGGSLDE